MRAHSYLLTLLQLLTRSCSIWTGCVRASAHGLMPHRYPKARNKKQLCFVSPLQPIGKPTHTTMVLPRVPLMPILKPHPTAFCLESPSHENEDPHTTQRSPRVPRMLIMKPHPTTHSFASRTRYVCQKASHNSTNTPFAPTRSVT